MSNTPEGQLLRLCMDWLAAERIFALRMNTGTMKIDKRFVQFGLPGCADIVAFRPYQPWIGAGISDYVQIVYWLELKAPKGKQSELQKSFQAKVESEGHKYAIIRSLEDLENTLR